MPEMAAPRALVSRPLVKGNEESENEIGFLGADQKERGLWGRVLLKHYFKMAG